MDVRSAFPSKFLSANDLAGKGAVRLTIRDLRMEKLNDGTKPVLYFAGTDKGLVLNKTNMNRLAEVTGTFNSDSWTGFKISLYVTSVDFQGKPKDAIRINTTAGTFVAPATRAGAKQPAPPLRNEPPLAEEWDSGPQDAPATPATEPADDDDDIPF